MSGAIGSIVGGVGGFLAGGPVGAAIGAGIGGAVDSANASQNAADAQIDATNSANATTMAMYRQNREDLAPYRDVGTTAITRLSQLTQPSGELYRPFSMSDFQTDPGYQFRLSEGEKAINRAASAAGRYDSPRTIKDLIRFNQGTADQAYNDAFNRYNTSQTNQFNRLAAIAGVGQNATNQTVSDASNTGAIVGQNTIGAGNARASGYVGSANAINNGIGSAYGAYNSNRLLSMLPGLRGYGGYGSYGGYNGSAGDLIPLA